MNDRKIFTTSDLRKTIINSVLAAPTLGVNYIDYHYEDGRCGLALNLGSYGGEFEIIITRPETTQFGNDAFTRGAIIASCGHEVRESEGWVCPHFSRRAEMQAMNLGCSTCFTNLQSGTNVCLESPQFEENV